jgi:alkaline phosphatase D
MQTRRQFVAGAGVTAAATVLAPQAVVLGQSRRAPLLRGGRFSQGVMSGEPTTRSIVLWSQVEGVERSGTVRLEVARDRDFRRVVARELIGTDGNIAHTVKARVTGLRPAERYYYRFETATEQSPVGRFKTAPPADSNEPIRFAFFSCAEYTHGFYNAYAAMAREDDLDFVVCLGDYIYESPLNPQSETGPYTTVRRDTVGEANSVAEYRDKYRLYRSDPGLRAVHRNFPLVTIWDDHEVEDNYAGGDPSSEDYDPNRRRAGYRAWFENMPIYPTGSRRGDRIYRSLRFGRNVELLMLDQRQYRDNQPCNDRPGPEVPRGRPAARLPRPPADELDQGPPRGVQGDVEDHRQRAADLLDARRRELHPGVRRVGQRLPRRAPGAAQPHPRQEHPRRRVHHRRRALLRRGGRAHRRGRREHRRRPRLRRRVDQLGLARASRSSTSAAAWSCRATTRTRTRPTRS